MSTDIRIDVTRNALQELAEQIRDENQKNKRSREEKAELTGPTSRLDADQPPADLRNPAQEDDPSNVPELYKKDEPAAFNFPTAPNVCNAWYRAEAIFEDSDRNVIYAPNVIATASGLSIEYETFGGNRNSWYWDSGESGSPSNLWLNEDGNFVAITDQDALQALVSPSSGSTFVAGGTTYNSGLGDFVIDPQSLAGYLSGSSNNGRVAKVALPVDRDKFIFCDFYHADVRLFQRIQNIASDGFASYASSTLDYSISGLKCFLIGPDNIKQVSSAAGLSAALARLFPKEIKEADQFIGAAVGYPRDIGGVSVYDIETFLWSFLNDNLLSNSRTPGFFLDETLSDHYLLNQVNRVFGGTPAVYWCLENFNETENRLRFIEDFNEVRSIYPQPTYGNNPLDQWLTYIARTDQNGARFLDWYIVPGRSTNSDTIYDTRVNRTNGYEGIVYQPDPNDVSLGPVGAWDVNVSDYCRSQLLNLGFRPEDLEF